MKFRIAIAAALFALCAAHAWADQVDKTPVLAHTLDSFNQESAKIHQQMQAGGIYDNISPGDRARVETRLSEMQKLLEAHSTQSDMPRDDKVKLVNAQSDVNSILSHNDNNRLICENRAPVGSHIPVTTCRTYGEIAAQRRQDQKFVDDASTKFRTPTVNGH